MIFTEQFTEYKLPIFELGVRMPEIKISPQERAELGLKEKSTNTEFLKKYIWKKCLEKIEKGEIKQSKEKCIDRLKMEFGVFEKTGTIDYILLLMDVFLWCDKNNILRGPARGSAAASFALYCTNLTHVNPLDFDLNFTRFLSEARVKPKIIDGIQYADGKTMCDFDGDIEYFGREKCIKRLEQDYEGKTCKILTLQYLTGKMALKDTVKSYLDYNETQALEIGSEIEILFGKVDPLSKTYEKSKRFKEWAGNNNEAFTIAQKIEGLLRTSGIHASGMLISYHKVNDILPMELSATGEIVSGYDMSDVLQISVKCDVLGLKTLTQIELCCNALGIKPEEINIHDKSIYDYYVQPHKAFFGLFQIEDGSTKEATLKIKPRNIEQLSAVVAISRPGAIKYIDQYAKFVNTGERTLIYDKIDELLINTGSIILYQEQINNICQKVYGLSATDADEVRRAIGKKIREDMAKWEPIIFENGKKLGVPEEATKWFWQTCSSSADYLFNQAHAVSYAYLTAYTTYLKANHPLQFFLSCLKIAKLEADPMTYITSLQNELKYFNISLLSPDILKSQTEYVIEGKDIRMGLSGIKGLSDKGLEKLQGFKSSVLNKFQLFQNLTASKIPLGVCSALILSGCFDSISCGAKRSKLLLELEVFKLLTDRELSFIINIGKSYNYDLLLIIKNMVETLKTEKGKPIIKESRFATIKRDYEQYKQKFITNSKFESLSAYIFENNYLGFSYSATLKKIYSEHCVDLSSLSEITEDKILDTKFRSAVQVVELENRVSKEKKTKYLSLLVKDDTKVQKMMLFGEDRLEATKQFNGREVKEGDILIVNGTRKKNSDAFFLDSISIQENPVVIRVSELAAKELSQL
jgi:DNA polymerase-3 subunit alpha